MNGSDRIFLAMLALIRSGLSERPLSQTELSEVSCLDAGDWAGLWLLAREQSVRGVVYRGLTHLPKSVEVPGDVVFGLMADAESIRLRNLRKDALSARLMAGFRSQGLTPCIMKGSSVAAFYPLPGMRESGDIDLFFPKEQIEGAKACLRDCHLASDGSVHASEDGVDLDLHDRYYDLPAKFTFLPEPGSPEGTLVMLSAHILKHAVGAGVGLRQLCDMAMACRSLAGQYAPAHLWDIFRRCGLLGWNKLLFSFLTDYLDLPASICDKRVASGPLLRIVREGGHFGHYAATRRRALDKGGLRRKTDTLWRFLRRLPFSLHYAPRFAFFTFRTLLKGNIQASSSQARGTEALANSISRSETTT